MTKITTIYLIISPPPLFVSFHLTTGKHTTTTTTIMTSKTTKHINKTTIHINITLQNKNRTIYLVVFLLLSCVAVANPPPHTPRSPSPFLFLPILKQTNNNNNNNNNNISNNINNNNKYQKHIKNYLIMFLSSCGNNIKNNQQHNQKQPHS